MGYEWKIFGRALFFFVLLQSTSGSASPREFLHVVYVTNRDRAPLPNYKARLHRIMADVQDFYRTEMERNGYGSKTFRLHLGKDGNMIVHLVTLDWDFDPERKFSPRELRPVIAETLRKKGGDVDQEYMVVFQNAYWKDGETSTYDVVYTGSGDPVKGSTWAVDHEWLDPVNIDPDRKEKINDRGQRLSVGEFNVKMIGGVAHEFGHGLGLPHNHETKAEFRQYGKALMGAGNYTYRQERLGKRSHGSFLTQAHAFVLSLHPLFSGKIPAGFEIPSVFPEELSFVSKGGMLLVSGRIAPMDEVAGIILYHDPLPTGVNKDYDAFSYLAEMKGSGMFSSTMPLMDEKDCALHLKVYFKNGMHRTFSFNQENGNGLETLRTDYLREKIKQAFLTKDAAMLKTLLAELEPVDPEGAQRAQLFLRISEQWKGFRIPAEIDRGETKIFLSSTRWDDAAVGWYVPSFNGVLEPDGKWFRPLESLQGKHQQGLYAHAPSHYTYTLGGKWARLKVRVAIQRGGNAGSVIFVIKGDGKELYRSSLIRFPDGEFPVDIDVSGIQTVELITEPGGDGTSGDWGIWISPTLLRRK